MLTITRFDIWLVQLDPTIGTEIQKTRPCVVISPQEMAPLSTVIVAPMTTQGFNFPMRVPCTFKGKNGLILLDQIRAVDKTRLIAKKSPLSSPTI
jgi:mRNA interferase MazF